MIRREFVFSVLLFSGLMACSSKEYSCECLGDPSSLTLSTIYTFESYTSDAAEKACQSKNVGPITCTLK